MKLKKCFLKICFTFICFFIFVVSSLYFLGVRFNHSSSYPLGIYLIKDGSDYELGDLVLFCPPKSRTIGEAVKRGYMMAGYCQSGSEPVIKKIFGSSGDIIELRNGVVFRNSEPTNFPVLSFDRAGRNLSFYGGGEISEKMFFMVSDYQPYWSFDSRYFGPIPSINIIGKIEPLIIFEFGG
ncbi:conjugative transfer signal peptidase TraF [Shewanella algae]|uniref:conjugative transfer signal peptidase TraF n=1 Tax=Shewanella algae TaxID=38313 RepID=UPI001AAD74A2|nr:conjugative transfer signal peptidase TraF [Shewanella algae]MBO2558961.1 conjugative transfer signal peptidase TraF [Shewanella algae]MBO2575886.1 conjugative transfer signal peptidase TraF [Shewanella algae]